MNQAIDALRNAFKIPELRQRIVFTVLIVAVYRLGAHVPTPGIDGAALSEEMGRSGGMLGLYNLFTGGAFEQASIFALGIMPYISASIIFQLLVAVVPTLERIAKSGPDGQKKITEYTRYATIGLAIFQSLGIAALLQRMSGDGSGFIMVDPLPFYLICIITFTAGTAFIMWLGEQVSEFGVGNGMSLIIFVSIIAGLPGAVGSLASMFWEIGPVRIILLMFGMVILIAGVIYVTTAQRRIPVQYPRQVRGREVRAGSRNYLPLKVTQAGVIPIIFAASILMLPGMVVPALGVDGLTDWYQRYLVDHSSVMYNVLYAFLIIFFSYFYTAIIFNPLEYAENLQKQNAVILGVRPGKTTAEYLNTVMIRITFVGSMFLAGVALVPNIVFSTMEIYDWRVAQFFGGTSLLILVGVGLDTVRQIETHLTMRNYDGFMKGRPVKGRRRF